MSTSPPPEPRSKRDDTSGPLSIAPQPERLVSLDVFRGLTMVLMILVNNPGTWSAAYPPLVHADWHGWTPTDLVFPFFLFIVGVALVFSFTKHIDAGVARSELTLKTLKRSAILFGLGLILSAFPFIQFYPEFGLLERLGRLRLLGVLQRIALCYAAAALLFLYVRPRARLYIASAILLGYWAAMTLIPVPGFGPGQIDDPVGNLASWFDRLVMGNHLPAAFDFTREPEGLFSTPTALVTVLLGVWTGRVLIDARPDVNEKTARLMVAGTVLAALGGVWGWFFPINKPIWTSSYVLLTGGLAMLTLGVCFWWIDGRTHRGWTRPFVIYGVNAITVFFLSGIFGRMIGLIHVPAGEGSTISIQTWIYTTLFAPVGPAEFSSLLYAITWVLGWYAVLHWMYRRGITIRV